MINNKELLKREKNLTLIATAITIACALTGVVTYIINDHFVWVQWTVLFHLLLGIACSFILALYLITHFNRVVGFRRPSVLISGLLTILLFFGFVYSGWNMLFLGQRENSQWVYNSHLIFSVFFIFFVVLHLFLHVKLLPEKRKNHRAESIYPSLSILKINDLVRFNVIIILLIFLVTIIYQLSLEEYINTTIVGKYEYNYGQHRFRPSQTETSNNAFIDQRRIANSHKCIACHETIVKQWISSVHSQAASDPTYVTNINLLAQKKGISATRYCEGCHAPVALLTGELTPGGQHGGVAGTPAHIEGVSCMGCHGIESLVHLKGVASFKFKPAKDYLFEQSSHPVLVRLNNLLIRVKPDQHKKDLGKQLFKEAKFCAACHAQFMDKDMNDWGWVKMQDEYSAWLESPYSKSHNENFANATVQRCQDCHMPFVAADDPSSNNQGQIRAHHFPGANTFLPIINNDQNHLQATKDFLQSNKLRISIEEPSRKDALQSLHVLDERLRNAEEAPHYYYLGERAEINVIVTNNGVGHDFPGGTIDINQAWVEFFVFDAEGSIVFSSGTINSDNIVDPAAYFYRSLPVDRYGNLVWKHDLFNMVGESFRRVIKAGESDIVKYTFEIPGWVKSPLTITTALKYRKLNERYAKWALKDKYVKIPVLDLAWDSLDVPIHIRKEVE